MAKQTSNYPITGADYRWGDNTKTGEKAQTPDSLPHSGEQIRKYIGTKAGAWTVIENTLYAFENNEAKEKYIDTLDPKYLLDGFDPVELGSGGGAQVDFRVNVNHEGDFIVNGSAPYYVSVYVKSTITEDDVENPYDSVVNLELLVTLNGQLTTYPCGRIEANKSVSINIAPHVADGAMVRFRAYDDSGYSRTTTQLWNVYRANLQLSTQNSSWWANAFVQGDTSWGVPLYIDYNVASQILVTLTDSAGVNRGSMTIPSSAFSQNYALKFDHPITKGGQSGVYHLKMELKATDPTLAGMQSSVLEYNIFCVSTEDTSNYFIINNEGSDFKNYATNKMFDYAVRIGFGNASIKIISKEGTKVITDSGNMSVVNNRVYSYNLSLEMERLDDADFTLNVSAVLAQVSVLSKNYTFSNKDGYSATSGANVLIRMNGRSNTETNRAIFYNAMTGAAITPEFTNMAWSESDGYMTEEYSDGTRQSFFRLLGGSFINLPIKPLQIPRAPGQQNIESRTLEILFRVKNVLDYDTPIIECLDIDGTTFNGLKVTPNKMTLLAPSAKVVDDQSVNYDCEDVIHMTIVARAKAEGETTSADNYSGCFIYINGSKQKAFSFNTDLNVASNLVIGSANADIDIFAIRTYRTALTNAEVENNTTNFKLTEEEKQRFKNHNNVRENGKVNFNKVRSMCNVFVVKTENDELPSISWDKTDFVKANIDTYFVKHPNWNWSISNLQLYWQGTTSHGYLRQNLKGTTSTPLDFDGGTHAPITSICWKKNFASSMQSHKIGSVNSYTELARACGVIDEDENASIFQYPFVGFQLKADGSYTFIGLYTAGPDKGDKDYFGFGDNTIALEGSDNEPLGTNFRIPWNEDTVEVDSKGATYKMVGVKSWEDSMKHPSLVTQHWAPAYNLVYGCAQTLRHIESLEALSEITAQGYTYWLTSGENKFKCYYYNSTQNAWLPDGTDIRLQLANHGYGLSYTDVDTATDMDELNEKFKAARIVKFHREAGDRFDINNALFHLAFIEFHAASDNLAKNTYPYIKDCSKAKPLVQWRQDDLDSIFDTENQGKAYKQYCVEIGDNYSEYGRNPQSVFNGISSQFWLLIREAFASEYREFMAGTFIKKLHYGPASNSLSMVMAHFEHYYFDNAQNHFPEALYNEDGKYCYEQGALTEGYDNASIALSQMLGNHLSAEKYWVKMRYIYMASKYTTDAFGIGQDDVFMTRPYFDEAEGITEYTIAVTPAIYMYPSIQLGNSQVVRGIRVYPGNAEKTWNATFDASETSDQEQRINGMSYIRSLGDMYKAPFDRNITVNGKMLTELHVGTKTDVENIHIKITSIGKVNAPALRIAELANLTTLQGVNDFSVCTNLREMYAEGTAVSEIKLSDGGALQKLHLPSTITNLSLIGKKYTNDLDIAGTNALTILKVSNCNDYTIGAILDIIAAGASALASITLGFGTETEPNDITPDQLSTLIALCQNTSVTTKQFSGYISCEDKVEPLSADDYMVLFTNNITYIGDVETKVTLVPSADTEIVAEQGLNFTAVVIPYNASAQPTFRLYNSAQALATESEGIYTSGNVTLNATTGQLTSTLVSTDNVFYVDAIYDGIASTKTKVVVKGIVYATDVNIGTTSVKDESATEATQHTIPLTWNAYTVAPTNIAVVQNTETDACSVKTFSLENFVIETTRPTEQTSVSFTISWVANGQTRTKDVTITLQYVPVNLITIAGEGELKALNATALYNVGFLPTDANVKVANWTVEIGEPVTTDYAHLDELGVAIQDKEGVYYSADEWTESGKTADDAEGVAVSDGANRFLVVFVGGASDWSANYLSALSESAARGGTANEVQGQLIVDNMTMVNTLLTLIGRQVFASSNVSAGNLYILNKYNTATKTVKVISWGSTGLSVTAASYDTSYTSNRFRYLAVTTLY